MAKAKARDVPNVYVVARYKPAGNVVNQFQMNVKPKPQWNPTIIRQTSFSFCEKGRFMNVKSIQIKKSRIFWFSPFLLLFSWSKYQKHLSTKWKNFNMQTALPSLRDFLYARFSDKCFTHGDDMLFTCWVPLRTPIRRLETNRKIRHWVFFFFFFYKRAS